MRPQPWVEPRNGVQRAELVRDREVLHGRGAREDGFEERFGAGERDGLEEVGERSAGQLGRILR